MKIVDEKCLARFRVRGNCEHCGLYCERREPHHWHTKRGMGGGTRLDIPINLVSLCHDCHRKAEERKIAKAHFLMIVVKRERVPVWEINKRIRDLLRRKKWQQD